MRMKSLADSNNKEKIRRTTVKCRIPLKEYDLTLNFQLFYKKVATNFVKCFFLHLSSLR